MRNGSSALAATVLHGIRVGSWNTKPMRPDAIGLPDSRRLNLPAKPSRFRIVKRRSSPSTRLRGEGRGEGDREHHLAPAAIPTFLLTNCNVKACLKSISAG